MEISTGDELLKKAINGDINAFQSLFAQFQGQLRSYLYRLLADRNDVQDLTQDVFVKAFDRIGTFRGECSLKTWVFQIATHLAYNHLKKYKRWNVDAQDKSKAYAMSSKSVQHEFEHINRTSAYGNYEIKEHIDFCFTCISKTLTIEHQVALILKDIYDFSVNEVADILGISKGVAKHLLVDARRVMKDIFDNRCALINKEGACHQCTELNGFFNPKQNQQEELMKLELVRCSTKFNRDELYKLRTKLVKGIDPLRSDGADIQEAMMKCTRIAVGELNQS